MARKLKGLVLSDFHSGHLVGLSPPRWHNPLADNEHQYKYAAVRKSIWEYLVEEIVEPYRPFDFLIINGDTIEGRGEFSGSTEIITADRNIQCKIAIEIIEYINAAKVMMTYGTKVHVSGSGEDWEDQIAHYVGAKIGSHEWYDINGKIWDCKHKIATSQIPYGRLTALARDIMWNRDWASQGLQPRADVLIRSHAHYFEEIYHDECKGFITPALQGFGSKFGARECSGIVNIGGIVAEIEESGEVHWIPKIAKLETQVAKVTKIEVVS